VTEWTLGADNSNGKGSTTGAQQFSSSKPFVRGQFDAAVGHVSLGSYGIMSTAGRHLYVVPF
jgi:hypothetical protein